MKNFLKILAISGMAFGINIGVASASCSTIGTYTTCSDGNTYNKVGNTTFGSNANTGSTWSQTQIGNTTFGTNSEGKNWSTTRIGNHTFGTDGDGNSWSSFGD